MLRRIFRKSSSSNSSQSDNSVVEETKSDLSEDASATGIVVDNSNSVFSSSALKLILDNIATREDLDNVMRIDDSDSKQICEFCKKPFEPTRFCCPGKEMHTILINEALQKVRFVSAFTDKIDKTKGRPHKGVIHRCSAENINTFKTLKRKMSNFKKYYPYLYNHDGDVLECWGNGALEENVSLEVLELEGPVFWV